MSSPNKRKRDDSDRDDGNERVKRARTNTKFYQVSNPEEEKLLRAVMLQSLRNDDSDEEDTSVADSAKIPKGKSNGTGSVVNKSSGLGSATKHAKNTAGGAKKAAGSGSTRPNVQKKKPAPALDVNTTVIPVSMSQFPTLLKSATVKKETGDTASQASGSTKADAKASESSSPAKKAIRATEGQKSADDEIVPVVELFGPGDVDMDLVYYNMITAKRAPGKRPFKPKDVVPDFDAYESSAGEDEDFEDPEEEGESEGEESDTDGTTLPSRASEMGETPRASPPLPDVDMDAPAKPMTTKSVNAKSQLGKAADAAPTPSKPAKKEAAADKESSSEEDVFTVDKIVDHRKKRGKFEFLVKWEGFPDSSNTWEKDANIFDRKVVNEYWATHEQPMDDTPGSPQSTARSPDKTPVKASPMKPKAESTIDRPKRAQTVVQPMYRYM